MPSIGASMKRPPSGVAPACTGWAMSAAELTTTKSSSAIVDDTITTRRRPRRPTRTSPARPEAASTPISATQATPRAKIAFSHFGASPSSTESAIAPASKNWTNAIPLTATSTTIAVSETRSTVRSRRAVTPRMLIAATSSSASPATTTSMRPSSMPGANTAR